MFAYFFNFHTISHISVVARKWIIIIRAKYLMFPLFERAHKQMRHQRFIARTITRRLFPTVGPGPGRGGSPLCLGAAGREPAQGSDHHSTDTHTHTHTHTQRERPPLQSHSPSSTCRRTHLWSLKTHVSPPLCVVVAGS